MSRIPPSPSCSSRPSISPISARSLRRGESGRPTEPEIWAAHLSVADGEAVGEPEFETDRARFLGRGQGVRAPIAVLDGRPLSNSVGAVLDPIFALRRRVHVAAGATVRVAFWTMAAGTRAALLDCVDKHRDAAAYERATTLAWTQAQVQLHHLGVKPGEAGLFQRLASHVIFAGRDLRPSSEIIRQGVRSAIRAVVSGHFRRSADRAAADRRNREHLRRQADPASARILADEAARRRSRHSQRAQHRPMCRTFRSRSRRWCAPVSRGRLPEIDHRPGRVFVLRADLIDADMRALLVSAARVVLVGATRQPVGPTRSRRRLERADPTLRQTPRRSS